MSSSYEMDEGGPAGSPLLKLHGIRKSFGPAQILKGIDFSLQRGEVHALIGHNGAGKSTLLKVIAGVFSDYEGDVILQSELVRLVSPKIAAERGIAIIHQDFALCEQMTVAHNVALGREPRRFGGLFVDHKLLRAQSECELREFEIDLPLNACIASLGVAGKQMTEIAKALAKRARILIMDEPTARLAPDERGKLFGIIKTLARSGVGIIYVSHFLDEVKEIANRVSIIRDGAAVKTCDVDQISVEEMAQWLIGEVKPDRAPAEAMARQVGHADVAMTLTAFSCRGRPPVDLSLSRGEIYGIAGLVGSGRTSFLRAIVGDLSFSGSIGLNGTVLSRLDPTRAARQGIVMVPEDRKVNGLALNASVRANMELTALTTGLSRFGIVRRKARDLLVQDAIRRFQVRPADSTKVVSRLSGGNAQKVLLARAAVTRPRVLLLDQPTAGVDIGAKIETIHQIKSLAAQGTAIVLVSDDLDELLDLSDRISVMGRGKLSPPRPAGDFDRPSLLAAISRSMAS